MNNPFADLISPQPMLREGNTFRPTGGTSLGDAQTPLDDAMRFSPPGGFNQFNPVPGVRQDPGVPAFAPARGGNLPAGELEPYRTLRPLRRSTPSDPSRPDAGEALAMGALNVATFDNLDEIAGALSAVPQAAEIPVDAARWLYQRLSDDAASADEDARRVQDAFTKTLEAYQMGRRSARHRRHQAEDEYPGATNIGNMLGAIGVAHRLGVPLWRLVPFLGRYLRSE
jgi:hypothetical protein